MIIYNICWFRSNSTSVVNNHRVSDWLVLSANSTSVVNNHRVSDWLLFSVKSTYRCWVGTKQLSFTHSTITYNICWVAALNNNHSLTPMIIYNRCWDSAKNNHSLTVMVIYNRCWFDAKQQSITHSMIIYNRCSDCCLAPTQHPL
jgi:hypothetical protein